MNPQRMTKIDKVATGFMISLFLSAAFGIPLWTAVLIIVCAYVVYLIT